MITRWPPYTSTRPSPGRSHTTLVDATLTSVARDQPEGPSRDLWWPLVRFGPGALLGQLLTGGWLVFAVLTHGAAGIAGRLELSSEAVCLALVAVTVTRVCPTLDTPAQICSSAPTPYHDHPVHVGRGDVRASPPT